MGGTGTKLNVHVALNSRDYERGAGRATRSTKQFERVLRTAGAVLGAIGFAVSARELTQLSNAFDTAFVRINTLVGVSQGQISEWRAQILEMAPRVGQSAQAMADALFVVTSAGARGAEAMDILERSAMAATSGLGETQDIARAVTAAIQAYGAENLDAATAVDQLLAIVREGNLEASQLATSIGRALGPAAQMGVSLSEAGAFIATFTRLGVSASEAVTGLAGVMNALIKPSEDGKKVLQQYGSSIDELRRNVSEEGLSAALNNLLVLFDGNTEALGRVIPDIQALAGVLGTAGRQGEAYAEIARNIAEAHGQLTESALEATKASPEQALKDLKVTAEAVALAMSTGMAEALADAARDLTTWLAENQDLIVAFGQRVGEVAAEIMAVLVPAVLRLVTSLEDLAPVLAGIVAIRAASWLTTAATSAGIAASAWKSLTGIVAAARAGYLKLVLLNVVAWFQSSAAAMTAWAGTAAAAQAAALGVVGAVVALIVRLRQMTKEWGLASEAAMKYEVQQSKHLELALKVSRAKKEGPIDPELWEEGKRRIEEVSIELEAARQRLAELKKDRMSSQVGGAAHREMQALEEQVEMSNRTLGVLQNAMTGARKSAEDLAGSEGGGGEGGGTGLGKLQNRLGRLQAALDSYGQASEVFRALQQQVEALRLAQDDLDEQLVAKAIELGVDPIKAVTGELDDMGVSVRGVVLEILTLERELANLQGGHFEISVSLTEAVMTDRIGDEITVPEIEVPVGLEITDEEIAELSKQYEKHMGEKVNKEIQAITEEAWRNIQNIAADALANIVRTGELDFEALADSMLGIMSQMLAKLLIEWTANAAKRIALEKAVSAASGTDGGGGGGGLGVGDAAGVGKTASGAGMAWGTIAAAGAVVAIVGAIGYSLGWWGSRFGEESTGTFGTQEDGGLGFSAAGEQAGLIAEKFRDAIEVVKDGLGEMQLEVEQFGNVTLNKVGRNYNIGGASLTVLGVENTAEAISEAVAVLSLRGAEFGDSVSDWVEAIIHGSEAVTMAALKADVEFARLVEGFGRSDLEMQIERIGAEMDQIFDRIVHLVGDNVAELSFGLNQTVQEEISRWDATRRQITGQQMSPQEQLAILQAQGEVWNAEKAMRVSALKTERQFLEAELELIKIRTKMGLNEIIRRREIIKGDMGLTKARLRLGSDYLVGRKALYEAEVEITKAALGTQTEIVNAAAAALEAQIAAITTLIDALEALPDIDISRIRLPDVGLPDDLGLSDLESFEQSLSDIVRSALPAWERSLLAMQDQMAELTEQAQELGVSEERLAEARRVLLDQWAQANVRDVAEPFLRPGDGGQFVDNDFERSAREIRDRFEEATRANEALLEQEGELAIERHLLLEAERRAIAEVTRDALAVLAGPMAPLRDQVQEYADALEFLNAQLLDGALSASEYFVALEEGQAVVGQQLMGMLAGIYDQLGLTEEAAEVRRQMEIANFHLQVAQLNYLYQQYLALGLISEEVADIVGAALDRVNQLAADFEPPTGPTRNFTRRGPSRWELHKEWLKEAEDARKAIEEQIEEWMSVDLGPFTERAREMNSALEELTAQAKKYHIATEDLTAAYRHAVGVMVDDALEPFERLGESDLERQLREMREEFEDIAVAFQEVNAGAGAMARLEQARLAAFQDLWDQALEPYRDLKDDLLGGALSPLTAGEKFNLAEENFDSAVAALAGGDLSQLDALPDLIQNYLSVAQDRLPTGSAAYRSIFGGVEDLIDEILSMGSEIGADEDALNAFLESLGLSPSGDSTGPGDDSQDPDALLLAATESGNAALVGEVREMRMEQRDLLRGIRQNTGATATEVGAVRRRLNQPLITTIL